MATPATSRTRESGRPCGCDPAADHPCSGHAAYVDWSETEIEPADASEYRQLVVMGPDEDGSFTIRRGPFDDHDSQVIVMTRFVAEDLITELARRLAERA